MSHPTRIAWTLMVSICLIAGAVPAWCADGDIHPLSRPGHPAAGQTPRQYAEHLLARYRQAKEDLAQARGEMGHAGRGIRDLQAGGGGGMFGFLALDKDDVKGAARAGELRRQIIPALEAEAAAVEREWNRWCRRHLRLGAFSDFMQLTDEQEDYTLRWLDSQAWDSGSQEMAPYREPPPASRPALDPPKRLGSVADASRATVFRANPDLHSAGAVPGTRVMQGSGQWVAAAEGWQVDRGPAGEPIPRNDPVTLGPFSIAPGKYRAHVSFNPPHTASMTAGNWNTSMNVRFAPTGTPERVAATVAGISVTADGKATEGQREFTIGRPGQIWVTFGPAGSRGVTGAWRHPEQSYTGYVELLERAQEETAVRGGDILPGDRIRAGRQAVTVELWDGTMVLLQPNAEITVDYPADGMGIRLTRERGAVRISRWGIAHRNIECVSGGRIIKPKGTDFILSDAGVEVISGEVEVSGEGEPVTVRAGEKLTYRTGRVEEFDAGAAGPALAADGIPAEPDYWSPSREPFGEKVLTMAGGVLDDGWLLADPPARGGARAEIEAPARGVLRVTVPANSRLDCGHYASDTSPRLLHKVTGDFDLEAEVGIEGESGYQASLDFLVRAPGAYPGIAARRSPGQWGADFTRPQGVGRSYWIPGAALGYRGNVERLPIFNVRHALWPEAGAAPVRVRFSRRDDVWATYWSRDGAVWEAGGLHAVDLPETLWVGWNLENATFGRAPNPVTFTFRDVTLRTAPLVTMERDWHASAQHGAVRADGASVRLTLDGTGPGSARAFSPGHVEGDFDVTVSVQAPLPELPAGDHVRVWSLAAVDDREQAVGFMCEARQRGTRYGLLRDTSDGYNAPTRADHWIPDRHIGDALGASPVRLRLTRKEGLITAHFLSEGEWKPARPDHAGRRLEGPVFLRLEAYNGDDKTKVVAPMNVTFTVHGGEPAPEVPGDAPQVADPGPAPAPVPPAPAGPVTPGAPADADFVRDEVGVLDETAAAELALVLWVLRERHDLHLAVVFVGAVEDAEESSRLATEHRNRLMEAGVLPARSGLLLYTQGGRRMVYSRNLAVDETAPVAVITQQWRDAASERWPQRVSAQLRGIYRAMGQSDAPAQVPGPAQDAPAGTLTVTSPKPNDVVADEIVVAGTAPPGASVRVGIRYVKQRFFDLSHDMPVQTVAADANGRWETRPVKAAHALSGMADTYDIRVELLRGDTEEVLSTVDLTLRRR